MGRKTKVCFVMCWPFINKTKQLVFVPFMDHKKNQSHERFWENHKSTCLRFCLVTQGRLQSFPLENTLSWEVITSMAFTVQCLLVLNHYRAESHALLPPPHPTCQSKDLLYLPVSWNCYSQGRVCLFFFFFSSENVSFHSSPHKKRRHNNG